MKPRVRNFLILIISIVGLIASAALDILDIGKLTTGFLGTAVLMIGTVIYPTIIEIFKEKKSKKQ